MGRRFSSFLVLALTLNSCAGVHSEESSKTSQSVPLTSDDVSEFPVGREWVTLMALDYASVDVRQYAERERRTVACMLERGFEYAPVSYSSTGDADYARATNPLNEIMAKEYGYVIPRFDNVVNLNSTDDAAFNTALNGANDDEQESGCAWQSILPFKPEYDKYFDAVNELLYELYALVDGYWSSSEGAESVAEWSHCMAESGYDVSSPEDAAGGFDVDADRPTESEHATRMADLACDRRVSLTAGRSGWERKRVLAWMDSKSASLDEARTLEDVLGHRLGELEIETPGQ